MPIQSSADQNDLRGFFTGYEMEKTGCEKRSQKTFQFVIVSINSKNGIKNNQFLRKGRPVQWQLEGRWPPYPKGCIPAISNFVVKARQILRL
jgi:hypothetical protein